MKLTKEISKEIIEYSAVNPLKKTQAKFAKKGIEISNELLRELAGKYPVIAKKAVESLSKNKAKLKVANGINGQKSRKYVPKFAKQQIIDEVNGLLKTGNVYQTVIGDIAKKYKMNERTLRRWTPRDATRKDLISYKSLRHTNYAKDNWTNKEFGMYAVFCWLVDPEDTWARWERRQLAHTLNNSEFTVTKGQVTYLDLKKLVDSKKFWNFIKKCAKQVECEPLLEFEKMKATVLENVAYHIANKKTNLIKHTVKRKARKILEE